METLGKKHFLYDTVLPPIEWLSWPLAGLGLVLRYVQAPGGSILLLIGLANLSIVYYLRAFAPVAAAEPSPGFAYDYESVSTSSAGIFLDFVLIKVAGITSAVALIGILFKLLFWNGSAVMLLVGTLTLVGVVAIQLARNSLSRRTILIAGLVSTVWAVPTGTLVHQFYRNDPVLASKMLYHLNHPKDQAAAKEVRQLQRVEHNRHKP